MKRKKKARANELHDGDDRQFAAAERCPCSCSLAFFFFRRARRARRLQHYTAATPSKRVRFTLLLFLLLLLARVGLRVAACSSSGQAALFPARRRKTLPRVLSRRAPQRARQSKAGEQTGWTKCIMPAVCVGTRKNNNNKKKTPFSLPLPSARANTCVC